jgi:hypothetical protein
MKITKMKSNHRKSVIKKNRTIKSELSIDSSEVTTKEIGKNRLENLANRKNTETKKLQSFKLNKVKVLFSDIDPVNPISLSKNFLQRIKDSFEIKESLIPHAGFGVFAKQDIERNTIICTYAGEIIPIYDGRLRIEKDYITQFMDGYCLVGDSVDGDIGHYINGSRTNNRKVVNVKYIFPPKSCLFEKIATRFYDHKTCRGRFYIETTKNISTGDELIAFYGKSKFFKYNS